MALPELVRLRPPAAKGGFSLDPGLIREIFRYAKPLGHHHAADTLNLGFGFIYYALVRTLRPKYVVVIGSGFGFSVVCLALGLKDNGKGKLDFVDPSYSVLTDGVFKTVGGTAQWSEPEKVRRHFARFGVDDWVNHHHMRSDQFFGARGPTPIDLAFIDGSHAFKDVQHDFLAVLRRARKNTYLLLHDSNIYIREFLRHAGVKRWLRSVQRRKDLFELVDFPFSSGVALVRVLHDDAWKSF